MGYPDRFGVTDKDVDLRLEAERLQDTLKGQPVARMKRQRNPGSVAALQQFLPDSAVAPSGLLLKLPMARRLFQVCQPWKVIGVNERGKVRDDRFRHWRVTVDSPRAVWRSAPSELPPHCRLLFLPADGLKFSNVARTWRRPDYETDVALRSLRFGALVFG